MTQVVTVRPLRVLALVDEANVVGAARLFNKRVDWEETRKYIASETEGRELVEIVLYAGLPPVNMAEFEEARQGKLRFVHALRTRGFLVVTKDGAPREGGNGGHRHYKANVDTLLAIDAMDLATEIKPDVVVLLAGDGDFAHLALTLRRRGIRVEVAAVDQNLANELKAAANSVIDLRSLFNRFENLRADRINQIGGEDVLDPIS